jgi:hypothetical protein
MPAESLPWRSVVLPVYLCHHRMLPYQMNISEETFNFAISVADLAPLDCRCVNT